MSAETLGFQLASKILHIKSCAFPVIAFHQLSALCDYLFTMDNLESVYSCQQVNTNKRAELVIYIQPTCKNHKLSNTDYCLVRLKILPTLNLIVPG